MKWISNKTLFNIHGWLGLNLGLLLFVICFSGTFATLSSEVDWLLNAEMRVEKKDAPIRWEKMHQSLEQKYPDGKVLGIYKSSYAGHGDHFASVAYVGLSNGQNRKVYLDPYTGNIQGDTSFFNVQRFFRSYHRRFFDGNRGIMIITLSSFFLLFSVLTGFLFYEGWLKNLFKLRLNQGIKTLFSDAHKLTGIWSLIFASLIALTGVFYFVELMFQMADNYEVLVPDGPPKIVQANLEQLGPNPELLSLDKYVANAKQAFPGLQVSTIRIPHQTDAYVYVDGQAGNLITRNRANKVYLYPFTDKVAHIQQSSELNTAEFITDAADPLHFGYFGGLTTKIIWFIFGLAISFAILSGIYLWYVRGMKKMDRKLRRLPSKDNTRHVNQKLITTAGFWSKHLTLSRGAVISTIIALIYLLITAISTVQNGIRSYGPLPEERFALIEKTELGPWNVVLKCQYPCTLNEGTQLLANINSSGLPNYTTLDLQMISFTGDSLSVPFAGAAKSPVLTFSKKVEQMDLAQIKISAHTMRSNTITQSVDIAEFKKAQEMMSSHFEGYPERAYPQVSFGVYAYIMFWSFLTFSIMICWTFLLVRSTSKQREILIGAEIKV